MRESTRGAPRQRTHDADGVATDDRPVPDLGPTVLVADRDDGERRALVETLEAEGMQTLEAASLAECLASMQLRDPDAVVIARDLHDEAADDPVTAVRAADDGGAVPIVLLTDLDAPALTTRAADDVVVRPLDPRAVLDRLRARLRQRSAWLSHVEHNRTAHALVVDALTRARPADDAHDVAAFVCRTVRRLPDVGAVAVLHLLPDARVGLLAGLDGSGTPLASDHVLGRRESRHLVARTASSAWMGPPPAFVDPGASATSAIFAPIRARGDVLGVLVLGSRRDAPRRGHLTRLAVATQVAAVAGTVLGPALTARTERHARRELDAVIRERAFQPVFQPIVDLADRALVGHEALTRFFDGSDADTRFEQARRLGAGPELEIETLGLAIDRAAHLPAEGWLSVNVSPTLMCEHFDAVAALLDHADRPLVVEITEHEPVEDYTRLRSAVQALGEDVRIAVDDVGSGYASLRHVLHLRPAFVKLDAGWVRDIDGDAARQALVAGLGYFGTYTGCRLVGEGVETEHEAAALAELGVAFGQGNLFGTPRRV
jgi:EAL domain-containing protein (putative c-di-GMP-specific phosphodiesterase class I)